MVSRLRNFRSDDAGTAAIEFALIANVLLILVAIAVDSTMLLAKRRDSSRLASQVALAIATSCSQSACVEQCRQSLVSLGQALHPSHDLTMSITELTKRSGAIVFLSGGTLGPDAVTSAQNVLRDGDIAIAVQISGRSASGSILSILPGFTKAISGHSVAVRQANMPII